MSRVQCLLDADNVIEFGFRFRPRALGAEQFQHRNARSWKLLSKWVFDICPSTIGVDNAGDPKVKVLSGMHAGGHTFK